MRWLPIEEQDAVSEMWLVWSKHHEQRQAAQRFVQSCLPAPHEHLGQKRQKCAVNHKAK
jgi:hypothetical protein